MSTYHGMVVQNYRQKYDCMGDGNVLLGSGSRYNVTSFHLYYRTRKSVSGLMTSKKQTDEWFSLLAGRWQPKQPTGSGPEWRNFLPLPTT